MIQKVSSMRYASTSTAIGTSTRQPATDGPETWGRWSGSKHYSLEVVQHPVRARMCGFGDKDRRPLAPAAVAKMLVKTNEEALVDADEIDYTFFVVTVDLWSSDGKQEMNLVLHPSSSDRYAPAQTAKPRRRAQGSHRSGQQSPVMAHATPNPPQPSSRPHMDQPQQQGPTAPPYPPSNSGYNTPPAYPPYQPPLPIQDGPTYTHAPQYPTDPNAGWSYPPAGSQVDRSAPQYTQQILPSIHSFGRDNPPASSPSASNGAVPPPAPQPREIDYRTWPTEPHTYAALDNSVSQNGVTSTSVIDPALRGPPSHVSTPMNDMRENQPWPQGPMPPAPEGYTSHDRYPQEQHYGVNTQPPAYGAPGMYPPPVYGEQVVPPSQPPYPSQAPYVHTSPPAQSIPSLPRHTYTRTLVGPLSANASRLIDDQRQAGIFFLFQDLSIRTEGTFRLRLRLMNVGAPPAPEPGAYRVHGDMSPILAQTFTEPFTVFSAKRFPGVPDTTALSIAFGNQGQKLPLRNRHGTNKKGRKRRRDGDSESSEDDSDA
ncbi:hypothetical protein JAAARDRAFT_225099 [Jaapia argillacea MUCL 33604]|uniref:Velvet domain-containing protein n=1 Tax=Jaapia argillacea MUCL 33604 TaxID=933084 RepID=A0A067QBG5_9AGAM|nr:hypothetical protein JAAARDRAFT_225099 [Jaapia argillacea MUCL 33604]